ncbi:hypothetical protein KWU23_07330 [Clostridioides difficile]|nr:hypothetical protein [Clostridioides difficile]
MAWILQFCGDISPPTTYNTTKSKNDGDFQKFVKIFSLQPSTDSLRICQTGEEFSLYLPLLGVILTIFENAKNKRKKSSKSFSDLLLMCR